MSDLSVAQRFQDFCIFCTSLRSHYHTFLGTFPVLCVFSVAWVALTLILCDTVVWAEWKRRPLSFLFSDSQSRQADNSCSCKVAFQPIYINFWREYELKEITVENTSMKRNSYLFSSCIYNSCNKVPIIFWVFKLFWVKLLPTCKQNWAVHPNLLPYF